MKQPCLHNWVLQRLSQSCGFSSSSSCCATLDIYVGGETFFPHCLIFGYSYRFPWYNELLCLSTRGDEDSQRVLSFVESTP